MSVIEIAEKKQQLKQDFDAVYEAGKASMVDESKIIEKTVSGSVISINDVSEIPHEIKCSISGVDNPESVRVVVVGKNICDNIWKKNGIHGDSGEFYTTTSLIHTPNYIPIKPDTRYTMSKVNFTQPVLFRFYDENKAYIGYKIGAVAEGVLAQSFKTAKNARYVRFNIEGASIVPTGQLIQLEEGNVATEYEPYNAKTYTSNADGNVEGVSSASPYMYLFADTVGANVELTYRQSWGIQVERKKMWEQIQWGGTRTDYASSGGIFNGRQWSFDNFYPRYDIRPVGDAAQMFYNWGTTLYGNHTGSLSKRLKECGVVLDTRQATTLNRLFYNGAFTEIPTIDFRGLDTTLQHILMFGDMSGYLRTIEKIIVKEELTYTNWFRSNTLLEHLVVEGVIGNTFDISASKNFTVESAKSILTHLKNFVGTDKEFVNSVLFHADVWSKLDAEGNTSPNGNTWEEYVADLGWSK